MSENVNFFNLQRLLNEIDLNDGDVENLTEEEKQKFKDLGLNNDEKTNTLCSIYQTFMKKIHAEKASERVKVMEELGKIIDEIVQLYGSEKTGLFNKLASLFGRAAGDGSIKTLNDIIKFFREEVAVIKNEKAGLNDSDPKAQLEKLLAKYMSYEYTTEADEENLINLLDQLGVKYTIGKETVTDESGKTIQCKTLQFEIDGKKYSFQTNRAATANNFTNGGMGNYNVVGRNAAGAAAGAQMGSGVGVSDQGAAAIVGDEVYGGGIDQTRGTEGTQGGDNPEINTLDDLIAYIQTVKTELEKGNLAPLNTLLSMALSLGIMADVTKIGENRYKFEVQYSLNQNPETAEFTAAPQDLNQYEALKALCGDADYYWIEDQIRTALQNGDKSALDSLAAKGVKVVITKLKKDYHGKDACEVIILYNGRKETTTMHNIKLEGFADKFGDYFGYKAEEVAGIDAKYLIHDTDTDTYKLNQTAIKADFGMEIKTPEALKAAAAGGSDISGTKLRLAQWLDAHPEGSNINDADLADLQTKLGGFYSQLVVQTVQERKGFDNTAIIKITDFDGNVYTFVDKTSNAPETTTKDGQQKIYELIEEFVSGNLILDEFADALGKTGLVNASNFNDPSKNSDWTFNETSKDSFDFEFTDINGNTYHVVLRGVKSKTYNDEKNDIISFSRTELLSAGLTEDEIANYFEANATFKDKTGKETILTYTLNKTITGITSNSTLADIVAAIRGTTPTNPTTDPDTPVTFTEIQAALKDLKDGHVSKILLLAQRTGVTIKKVKNSDGSYNVTIEYNNKSYSETITNPSEEVLNYLESGAAGNKAILEAIKSFTAGNMNLDEFVAALNNTKLVKNIDTSGSTRTKFDITITDIYGNTYHIVLDGVKEQTYNKDDKGNAIKNDIYSGTKAELKAAGFDDAMIAQFFYCSLSFNGEEEYYTLDLSKLDAEMIAKIKPGMTLKQIYDVVIKPFNDYLTEATKDAATKIPGYSNGEVFNPSSNYVQALTNLINGSNAKSAALKIIPNMSDDDWNRIVNKAARSVAADESLKGKTVKEIVDACLRLIFESVSALKGKASETDTTNAQELIDEMNKNNSLANTIAGMKNIGDSGKTYTYSDDSKFDDFLGGRNEITDEIRAMLTNKDFKALLLAALKNVYKNIGAEALEAMLKDLDKWVDEFITKQNYASVTEANAPSVKSVVDGFIAFVNDKVQNNMVSTDPKVAELAESLTTKTVDDVDSTATKELKNKYLNLAGGKDVNNGTVGKDGKLTFSNEMHQKTYDALYVYVLELFKPVLAKLGGEAGFKKLFNAVWQGVMGMYKDNVVATDTFIKDFMATLSATLKDEAAVQKAINGGAVKGVKAEVTEEDKDDEGVKGGDEGGKGGKETTITKTISGNVSHILNSVASETIESEGDISSKDKSAVHKRLNELLGKLSSTIKAIFIKACGKESEWEAFFKDFCDSMNDEVTGAFQSILKKGDSIADNDIIDVIAEQFMAKLSEKIGRTFDSNFEFDNISYTVTTVEEGGGDNGGEKTADGKYLGSVGYDKPTDDISKYFVEKDGKWYIDLGAVAELFPDVADLNTITPDMIKQKVAASSFKLDNITGTSGKITKESNNADQTKDDCKAAIKKYITDKFSTQIKNYIKNAFSYEPDNIDEIIDSIIDKIVAGGEKDGIITLNKISYEFDNKKVSEAFVRYLQEYCNDEKNNPALATYTLQKIKDTGLEELLDLDGYFIKDGEKYRLDLASLNTKFADYVSKNGAIKNLEDLKRAIMSTMDIPDRTQTVSDYSRKDVFGQYKDLNRWFSYKGSFQFKINLDGSISFVKNSGDIFTAEENSEMMAAFSDLNEALQSTYKVELEKIFGSDWSKCAYNLFNIALLQVLQGGMNLYTDTSCETVMKNVMKKFHDLLDQIKDSESGIKFVRNYPLGSLLDGKTTENMDDLYTYDTTYSGYGFMGRPLYDNYVGIKDVKTDNNVHLKGSKYDRAGGYSIMHVHSGVAGDDDVINAAIDKLFIKYLEMYESYASVDEILAKFNKAVETALEKLKKGIKDPNESVFRNIYGYGDNGKRDTYNGDCASVQACLLQIMFEMEASMIAEILK